MGMYVLADVCNREITLNWFDNQEEAKAVLMSEYESVSGVIDGEISEDGISAWNSARHSDNDWIIDEVPVDTYLRIAFEKYKDASGWRGLDAENAIESFIRFVGKEV